MTTGQRIKAARKKTGMTQAALAEKLGISYVGVSQWENDLRNPKIETLQRIATALDVPIQELVDKEELKQVVIYGKSLPEGGTEKIVHEDDKDRPVITESGVHFRRVKNVQPYRLSHSLGHTGVAQSIADQLNGPKARIATALDKLNVEGQEKAAERVEELTEIPRYQAAGQPTGASSAPEGTDTTPPVDGLQRSQNRPK